MSLIFPGGFSLLCAVCFLKVWDIESTTNLSRIHHAQAILPITSKTEPNLIKMDSYLSSTKQEFYGKKDAFNFCKFLGL